MRRLRPNRYVAYRRVQLIGRNSETWRSDRNRKQPDARSENYPVGLPKRISIRGKESIDPNTTDTAGIVTSRGYRQTAGLRHM